MRLDGWHRAALGALALVVAVVAFGLILEHTIGPSWAGGGGSNSPIGLHHVTRANPSAKRISPSLRKQLKQGPRPGARYSGADFTNVRGLRKAVVVQLGIGAIVIAIMLAWRRARHRLPRFGTAGGAGELLQRMRRSTWT